MSTVAKASITLTSVSDAYSVSLAPSVCVIHADFDGSNPVLTNAYTVISVYCGEVKVPFTILGATSSTQEVQFSSLKVDDYTYRISIDQLASDILEGTIEFGLLAGNDVNLSGKFQFTVERESTMLDWIQEWESNKTTIGATSIITPKLFVGKKITGSYDSLAEVPGLTGVYIGPSENDSCGLYGYNDSIEIFHLDKTGGKIGGWNLSQFGLYSSNDKLRILSNGSIRAIDDEGDVIWEIKSDGDASFAKEKVRFYANGDAEFSGKIKSSEGQIASWSITDSQLHCVPIALSAAGRYIAVANISDYPLQEDGTWDGNHFSWVREFGGAAMYYTSSSNFGIIAYQSADRQVFSAGSTNFIASWNFDEDALWIGEKNNNQNQYTVDEVSLTIGSEGLRGYTWYINANGTASFVKGLITFGQTYGNIAGWTVNASRLANDNVALISAANTSGLYITNSADGKFVELSPEAMGNFIDNNGGIYLRIKENSADLAAYNNSGDRLFDIKSGDTCHIAGWCFNNTALYTGTQATSGFTNGGDITLGPTGLRGYKWRFENDGSGALAGGNVSWDKEGNVTFSDNVSLNWTKGIDEAKKAADGANSKYVDMLGTYLTHIGVDGVYTGRLVADQIVAGTIDATKISADVILSNGDAWALNKDGSGYLANKNIEWDGNGIVEVHGSFSQDLHYIYHSDVILVSRITDRGIEDEIVVKLNNHLYVATNFRDSDEWITDNNNNIYWPYELPDLAYYTMLLPNDAKYIGKEIKIYDCNYGPFTRQTSGWCTTKIKTEGDYGFSSDYTIERTITRENLYVSMEIRGGYASFVGIPPVLSSSYSNKKVHWICVAFHGTIKKLTDSTGTEYDCLTS